MADTDQYYVFCGERVLARKDRMVIRPFSAREWKGLRDLAETVLPIDRGPGSQDFAVELAADFAGDDDLELLSLRSLIGLIDDDQFNRWGKAAQILYWQMNHRYCGRCGRKTEALEAEQARLCPACSLSWYPRISPCVIVLVTRGDELLLARSPRFRQGMYSTLAGFVEAGESVEMTIHREIAEEVSIGVKNIRYFASQPWPFPSQLMLGFFAEYDSGEIEIDGVEISDAGWYHCRSLPAIPGEGTIAGRLIRQYVEELNACRP